MKVKKNSRFLEELGVQAFGSTLLESWLDKTLVKIDLETFQGRFEFVGSMN